MVKGSNVKKFKMYSTSTAPDSTSGMDNTTNSRNMTSFPTSNDTLYTNWTTTLSPNATNNEHKFTKDVAKLHTTDIIIIFGIIFSVGMLLGLLIILYVKREASNICISKQRKKSIVELAIQEVKTANCKFRGCPVKIKDFPAYVDSLHKKNDQLFEEGFRLLDEDSPSHPTSVAETFACKPKTRYSNILPFDHSRVKLKSLGKAGSDFINANYIPGDVSQREYIATQGPFKETKNDFWRMIWEENVEFIVMLSKELEAEKGSLRRNYPYQKRWVVETFDPYWPDEVQGPVLFGDVVVTTISETVLTDYAIRVMEAKLDTEIRTITQFHFLRWPEQGCPKRKWPFINFVNVIRNYQLHFPVGRIVVHCSTGVGRTAVYIAVDRLLQHIIEHDDVDVYYIILTMRNFRSNMIKTKEQFIYIYDCLRHFVTLEEDEDDEEGDESQYVGAGDMHNIFENSAFVKE